jgi:hypothetical protein
MQSSAEPACAAPSTPELVGSTAAPTIATHNKLKLIVHNAPASAASPLRALGARRQPKTAAWLVPKDREADARALLFGESSLASHEEYNVSAAGDQVNEIFNANEPLPSSSPAADVVEPSKKSLRELHEHTKSRKEQRRYHRASTDDEDEDAELKSQLDALCQRYIKTPTRRSRRRDAVASSAPADPLQAILSKLESMEGRLKQMEGRER